MSALEQAAEIAQQGQALAGEGRWEEAALAFVKALQHAPGDFMLHNNLGVALFQAGRFADAARIFERAIALDPNHAPAHSGRAFARLQTGDQAGAIESFRAVVRLEPSNVQAHMALCQLLQVAQQPEAALAHQAAALEHCRLFSQPCTEAERASILVLKAPGDLQTNIPLDLLFDRRHYSLHDLYFVDGHALPAPDELPSYDLVFNAISESARALGALDAAERFIAAQPKPSLNAPALVRRLSRDNAPLVFDGIPHCRFPRTLRLARAALLAKPADVVLRDHGLDFPIVIRPIDSHAGVDFERIESADALTAYLARVAHPAFFVQPFVDYAGADGFFRKYRVMFVDGEPYPCHEAISRRWMIHYLNADMAEFEWMRDEEARFLADLSSVFAGPAMAALRAIGARCGLDYCGMDCTLDRDGNVLVFEIDAAMLVHLWDPIDVYPYKHQYVPRIFRAVERLVETRIAAARG